MLASHVVRHKLNSGTARKFGKFVSDFFQRLATEVEKGAASKERELLEYQQAISYGSAAGDSINKRLKILVNRLATFAPVFAPLLSSKPGAEDRVSDKAETVRELIHSTNEKYAASYGEDLFNLRQAPLRWLQREPCEQQNEAFLASQPEESSSEAQWTG